MQLPTVLTLLGSACTLASGAAISKTFALTAVSLSTHQRTQLAVGETEASVHILRAAAPNATAGFTSTPLAMQFSYLASSRQLQNGEYGLSDLVRQKLTVTFGGFDTPADGLFAAKQSGAKTCFVYGAAAGPLDGWSLCSTVAFYWSGTQEPSDGCEKVALEMQ
ncbi:hypothetical protein GGR51DRAFT_506161 [Nemania sp. FL0031]|nr:hypothetical protein GGR51DRAFT_506161 [Nemania sp. FL0031]